MLLNVITCLSVPYRYLKYFGTFSLGMRFFGRSIEIQVLTKVVCVVRDDNIRSQKETINLL